MKQAPNQAFFRWFQLPPVRQLPRGDGRPAIDRCLSDFGPHHVFRNPGLVRDAVGKLIAGRSLRNPRRHRQHLSEKLPPILIVREIESRRRLVQQVLEIRPRASQSFTVLHGALAPDKRIGVHARAGPRCPEPHPRPAGPPSPQVGALPQETGFGHFDQGLVQGQSDLPATSSKRGAATARATKRWGRSIPRPPNGRRWSGRPGDPHPGNMALLLNRASQLASTGSSTGRITVLPARQVRPRPPGIRLSSPAVALNAVSTCSGPAGCHGQDGVEPVAVHGRPNPTGAPLIRSCGHQPTVPGAGDPSVHRAPMPPQYTRSRRASRRCLMPRPTPRSGAARRRQ